jgi:predicted dehydrogenase
MRHLNVGVVGLGWAAGAHIEAFKHVDGARVAAVSSRRKLDAHALAERFGVSLAVHDRYEDLLADRDVDLIDICSPHPFHAAQAIAAARAGKHVLVEKPLALSWTDCLAVREAVREAGVRVCVCFELRFSAQFTLLRSVLDQGLIGDLHYGEVDYFHGIGPWYHQFPWNAKKELGGSSLLTAGCHALDTLLWMMGDRVEEVSSYATRSRSPIFAPYQYPTTTTTLLRFAGGQTGKVASSIDCLQPYYFHTHLIGSEGSVLDNKIYSRKLPGLSKARWTTLETSLVDSGDVTDHPYQQQFQALVDAIRDGRDVPLTGLEAALETHRVLFAADRSAAEGRPIRLSELG